MKSHFEREKRNEKIKKKNSGWYSERKALNFDEKFMDWRRGKWKNGVFCYKELMIPLKHCVSNQNKQPQMQKNLNGKVYRMHSKRIKNWTQFNNNE